MILSTIQRMLRECEGAKPSFPPTELFHENWLLRLVLDAYASLNGDPSPFSPTTGARWFSQAHLPSAFLPRYRGDHLAESRTRADGVVGHFSIGDPGRAVLMLSPEATQLVVIEAKLYSRLSRGVKNAPEYDQAARTVACLAEVLRRADRRPDDIGEIAYVVVAPASRIDDGVFARECDRESIRLKVRDRVDAYFGQRDDWYRDWFLPTLDRVDLRCLPWEDAIESIAFQVPTSGQLIDSFYGRCLDYNRPRGPASPAARRRRPDLPPTSIPQAGIARDLDPRHPFAAPASELVGTRG